MVTLNSLINPLIYGAKRRQFRVSFIELLFRKNVSEAKEFEKKIFRSSNPVASQERQQEREGHNHREDIQGREREEQHDDNCRDGAVCESVTGLDELEYNENE